MVRGIRSSRPTSSVWSMIAPPRVPAGTCFWAMMCEFGAWLSPVERCVRDAEVPGSNPGAPTLVEEPSRLERPDLRARGSEHAAADASRTPGP